LLYAELSALNGEIHGKLRLRPAETLAVLRGVNAVPLTADEFVLAQRFFPIVFSADDQPVPLALMGLNEGENVFITADDKWRDSDIYLPAYVRRYPFLLAKIDEKTEKFALLFDTKSEILGEYKDGVALFEDGEPTPTTNDILKFNEHFELAGQKTVALVDELIKHDLLMDGEVAIQKSGEDKPFVYRGFKMVNAEKLNELPESILAGMVRSGVLKIVFAHLASIQIMRELFAKKRAN